MTHTESKRLFRRRADRPDDESQRVACRCVAGRRSVVLLPATHTDGPLSVTLSAAIFYSDRATHVLPAAASSVWVQVTCEFHSYKQFLSRSCFYPTRTM